MDFNFFTLLYQIYESFLRNLFFLFATVSRKYRYYITYCQFRMRTYNFHDDIFVDNRFSNELKEQVEFPFLRCYKLDCKSNQEIVDLSPTSFENLRNIGIHKNCSKLIHLEQFKHFCNLPNNINTIVCESYPWEISQNIIIDKNTPYQNNTDSRNTCKYKTLITFNE